MASESAAEEAQLELLQLLQQFEEWKLVLEKLKNQPIKVVKLMGLGEPFNLFCFALNIVFQTLIIFCKYNQLDKILFLENMVDKNDNH